MNMYNALLQLEPVFFGLNSKTVSSVDIMMTFVQYQTNQIL